MYLVKRVSYFNILHVYYVNRIVCLFKLFRVLCFTISYLSFCVQLCVQDKTGRDKTRQDKIIRRTKLYHDVPEMKGRNSFFKLYHVRPFVTGTSKFNLLFYLLLLFNLFIYY